MTAQDHQETPTAATCGYRCPWSEDAHAVMDLDHQFEAEAAARQVTELRAAAQRLVTEAGRFLAFDEAGTPSERAGRLQLRARIEDVAALLSAGDKAEAPRHE